MMLLRNKNDRRPIHPADFGQIANSLRQAFEVNNVFVNSNRQEIRVHMGNKQIILITTERV